MNAIRKAVRELRILRSVDQSKKDILDVCEPGILNAVGAFYKSGHSGHSGSQAVHIINRLLRYLPITKQEDMPTFDQMRSVVPLYVFAHEELMSAGLLDKDSDYDGMIGQSVLETITEFSKIGDLVSSDQYLQVLNIFISLLRQEVLSPCTHNEWAEDVGHYMDYEPGVQFQCARCNHMFSEDGKQTWYDVNDYTVMGDDTPQEETVKRTAKHRREVSYFIRLISNKLLARGICHDQSKDEQPELDAFTNLRQSMDGIDFGSPKYLAEINKLGPALTHHYQANRHHPEHWPDNGVADMNIVDIVEMFCDWQSAANSDPNGNIHESIRQGVIRYGLSGELASILYNTATMVSTDHKQMHVERCRLPVSIDVDEPSVAQVLLANHLVK